MREQLKLFVGFDYAHIQQVAYRVCVKSIRKHSKVNIKPIVREPLQDAGLYWRDVLPSESTEFSHTRFLAPYLKGYYGWAIFCDSDFMWRDASRKDSQILPAKNAVSVVQHDLKPEQLQSTKMDGKLQEYYPRKNWSSLMVFNCAHPLVHTLTPEYVSEEYAGRLHSLSWAEDYIGSLPLEYNYLAGYGYEGTSKAVHFTDGIPLYKSQTYVEYADEWLSYVE